MERARVEDKPISRQPDFWLGLDNARRLWEERQEKQDEFQKLEERLEQTA